MPKITSLEIDLPAFKAESDLLWKTLCSVTTIDCLNCSCFSSAALPNDLAQQFTENYRLRLLQLRPYPTESYPNLPPPFELIAPRLPNLIGLEVSSSPPLFYQLCQVMENTTLEFTALKHLWLEIEISADEFLNSAQHLLTRCPGVEKLILDCSETSADFIVQFLELISTLWQNTLKVLIIKCNERNVKSLPSCFYVIVSAIPTVLRFTRLQLFGLQFGCASPATNLCSRRAKTKIVIVQSVNACLFESIACSNVFCCFCAWAWCGCKCLTGNRVITWLNCPLFCLQLSVDPVNRLSSHNIQSLSGISLLNLLQAEYYKKLQLDANNYNWLRFIPTDPIDNKTSVVSHSFDSPQLPPPPYSACAPAEDTKECVGVIP